jgi:hypothetical protein
MARVIYSLMFILALGLVQTTHAADKVTLPSTPEGTVETICKSLGDQKPQVIWSALPETYQKDIKEMIELFATNMDKEVYDTSITTIGKVAKILKTKKTFIVNNPNLTAGLAANNIKPEDFEKQIEGTAAILEIILASDLKSLDSLKTMDPETFLADTCQKVMKTGQEAAKDLPAAKQVEALKKMKEAKVTVVESSGDKAKLKVEVGEESKEMPFTKVDGKWVPEELAEGWDRNITKYKDSLKSLKISPEQKTQVLMIAGIANGVLASLENASSQEEFDKAVDGLKGMAGGLLGGGRGGRGGPPPGFAPPGEEPQGKPGL